MIGSSMQLEIEVVVSGGKVIVARFSLARGWISVVKVLVLKGAWGGNFGFIFAIKVIGRHCRVIVRALN
jgi:hypothetical protein